MKPVIINLLRCDAYGLKNRFKSKIRDVYEKYYALKTNTFDKKKWAEFVNCVRGTWSFWDTLEELDILEPNNEKLVDVLRPVRE